MFATEIYKFAALIALLQAATSANAKRAAAVAVQFAVIFEDEAAHEGKRCELLTEHFIYLGSRSSAVRAAGLLKTPGSRWQQADLKT